jgi:hypothetical protein
MQNNGDEFGGDAVAVRCPIREVQHEGRGKREKALDLLRRPAAPVLLGDAALVFVVEGEAEWIAKGGERALGGTRLGGLEGNVMRGLSRDRSTDTGADALAHDSDVASGDRYADLGRVNAGCFAALLFLPNAAGR